MRKALICGVSGQDGALLARLLLGKGYEVCGTSRDVESSRFSKLERLGIRPEVKLRSMSLNDFRNVLQVLKSERPDEIYNLAGQSSVALSFEQPVETLESISIGVLNLLEAIRFLERPTRLYNACSSECFGDSPSQEPANEDTPFRPRSPYATAKAAAFWQVANYREAYQVHACSGILFNHESELRPERFVTRKIVTAANRIRKGSKERLILGNLAVVRDWGWAQEYVDAMWRMLQRESARDYVIATGKSYTLEQFVQHVFEQAGLNWRDHVDIDTRLYRPSELSVSHADPARARLELDWRATRTMPQVATLMFQAELESTGG
jgi:GDPmannose 4,6-dehydratase